jgi:hypothetical protein
MRNLHFKNACGKGSFNTFNHKSYSEAFEIWLVWTQTRYLQQTRYRWVDTVDICRWWTLCGLAVACLACHARRRLYSLPGAKDMNQTALFYAARQGHIETIRYLISKVISLCWWGILLFLSVKWSAFADEVFSCFYVAFPGRGHTAQPCGPMTNQNRERPNKDVISSQ